VRYILDFMHRATEGAKLDASTAKPNASTTDGSSSPRTPASLAARAARHGVRSVTAPR
jgi:hypothetical protein